MALLKKIIIFLCLGGIIVTNTTCTKKKWFTKITYEGYVYDNRTSGNPVAGVSIVLNACNPGYGLDGSCQTFILAQTKTDASGHFYIHVNAARSKRYCPEINGNMLDPYCHLMVEQLAWNDYTKLYLN